MLQGSPESTARRPPPPPRPLACTQAAVQPRPTPRDVLEERRASIWSGCSVRIRLWPCLPRDCHRLLSILPTRGASVECPANWRSSLDPTSAGHFSCPGSTGLGVHAGQGSLPPRAAVVAGPIWPHLVGRCGGLRLKNPVGTGPVKVSGLEPKSRCTKNGPNQYFLV